jgi:hypothetical protein
MRGRGPGGEMAQTMYAHMNKEKKVDFGSKVGNVFSH